MTNEETSQPSDEDKSEPSVVLSWIHGGSMRGEFVDSVFNFMAHDILGPQNVAGRICVQGPYIADNRNLIVRNFLEAGIGEWLWSLDVDVRFEPDILEKMLGVADRDFRPVVGALYFAGANGDPEDRWWPVWREQQGDVEYAVMPRITIGEVYEGLTSVGQGCTLMHRSVLEAMRDAASEEDKDVAWFGHDYFFVDGQHQRLGEDLTFCSRARKLGFPITGFAYPLGHVKTVTVTAQTFTDQFRPAAVAEAPKPKLLLPGAA